MKGYRRRESGADKARYTRNANKVNLRNVVKQHPRGGRSL